MRLKKLLRKVLLGLLVFLAPLSLALASPLSLQNSRPLFSIFGGVARLNPSQTQSYTGADDTQFNYSRQVPYDFMGFAGLFLGLEHPLSNLPFFTQVGLEYTLFSGDKISGQHSVGMDPSTFTSYQYHYLFQSRQFLFKAKILTLIKQRFYPYLFFGLGPAFNTLGNFQVSPTQSGSLNLTPTFETHTQTAFSFSLGFGLDTAISSQLRVGIGYQFINLGRAALGNGAIVLNNFSATVPFTLKVSPIYANELFAQVTYLI